MVRGTAAVYDANANRVPRQRCRPDGATFGTSAVKSGTVSDFAGADWSMHSFKTWLQTLSATLATLSLSVMAHNATLLDDPYLWLEEVEGPRALDWVKARNAHSQNILTARPEYEPIRAGLLRMLDSKDKIAYVNRRGDHFYNFWQDEHNKRGLLRRTTLNEYRKAQPKWETVLDIDSLAKAENENWVFAGITAYGPTYTRALISLSRGGADATVVREFDLRTRTFVQDGFNLPEAKSFVAWLDADTILVGTDFGPGSMTTSGYPRLVKHWKRGTPLSAAETVFEGQASDVSVGGWVVRDWRRSQVVLLRSIDFYKNEIFLWRDGKAVKVDKPIDAIASIGLDWIRLELRSDWTDGGKTYPSGSLLVAPLSDYLDGKREFTVLFTPTERSALHGAVDTRDHVLVSVLDNVAVRLEEWKKPQTPGGVWQKRAVSAPFPGTLWVGGLYDPLLENDPLAEHYFLHYTDFLTPSTLSLARTGTDAREALKSQPAFFDSTGMKSEQHFATSKDGTKIPYFVVWPKDARADGDNPTLLYGYGGFEVSEEPSYRGDVGQAWLARGGVYVVANIRGGGEFGPRWHQAAVRHHKQRSYDDFIAVAQDLVRRKITQPKRLGIMGGSNGGLLVGAVLTQRPELFGAAVSQVPLLDMRRYHKLLAGASWMAEYGDPDKPEDWAVIAKYSPYHNVKKEVQYPRPFFTTSTRDDRVHPGHARKMVARMLEQGHEVLYYENIEGGHAGAADNAQRAHLLALEYAYLWMQLGK